MSKLCNITWGHYICCVLLLHNFIAPPAWSGEWRFVPGVQVRETITDNVTLAPEGQEEWDAITQINPFIRVRGTGRRLNLNLAYRLQTLFYAQDSDRNDIFHQLSANANVELVKERFFIDVGAAYSQRNIFNTGRVSDDNINDTGNRTNQGSAYVRPTWRERWGGYADTVLVYDTRVFRYDTDQVSDSNYHRVNLSAQNGPRSTQMTWNFNALYRREERDLEEDDFETYRSEGWARWPAGREFYLVGTAGREESNFRTTQKLTDGNFWSIGGGWSPSRFFTVEAGKGKNNEFVNLSLVPSSRSSLFVRYRDRAVGSNPGVTYDSRFEYRTRKARFAGTYTVQTTTAQQDSDEIQLGPTSNPFGGFTCRSAISSSSTPSLTNEVFVRDYFELSGGVGVGKRQDLDLAVYKQRLRYEISQDEEDSHGLCVTWGWQMRRRNRLTTSLDLNHINYRESDPIAEDADAARLRISFSHTFARSLGGSLNYSYRNRNSSNDAFSYDENRIEARLSKSF